MRLIPVTAVFPGAGMAAELLTVGDLRVEFMMADHVVYAVNGVSFALGAGEIIGIVGESGCGKSQMALALMGLLPRNARVYGSLGFRGRSLLSMAPRDWLRVRGCHMAMVFQNPATALNPYLRVSTQMIEVLRWHRRLSRRRALTLAIETLASVHIPDPETKILAYPFELSGGMLQRITIAMALLGRPDLLIADEPTTALDVTVQAGILALLDDINRRLGMAMIMISHDMGVVANTCHRVAVMYAGRIVETAPVEAFFAAPRHPYSRALLQAIPSVDRDAGVPLAVIPGQPPVLKAFPQGCVFAARCAGRRPECTREVPPWLCVAPGHHVSCFFPEAEQYHVVR